MPVAWRRGRKRLRPGDVVVFIGAGRTVRHLASPYPVGMIPNYTAEVHFHWDADWSQDDQRYEARIYEEESADEPIVNSKTADPVEVLAPPESAGAQTYYLVIDNRLLDRNSRTRS
jgi:hypothetical protein